MLDDPPTPAALNAALLEAFGVGGGVNSCSNERTANVSRANRSVAGSRRIECSREAIMREKMTQVRRRRRSGKARFGCAALIAAAAAAANRCTERRRNLLD